MLNELIIQPIKHLNYVILDKDFDSSIVRATEIKSYILGKANMLN